MAAANRKPVDDCAAANTVWVGDGQAGNVRLIDLGIAKRTAEDVSGRPLDDAVSGNANVESDFR
jgi:hypothetical protein